MTHANSVTRSTGAEPNFTVPIWQPAFFEFNGEHVAAGITKGQHSWYTRGQNFAVVITWLSEGETLSETDIPDEHALLVLDDVSVEVSAGTETAQVDGPAYVVLPAGGSEIVGRGAGFLLRVFSAHATDVVSRTINNALYETPNAAITPLPALEAQQKRRGMRIHRMADLPADPSRFGRIFRTESLMINWFAPQIGPRDTNQLTPHAHDDFEQASVTLGGDYVHHIRRPWTKRLKDWRPDEHVQVTSPSVTIIPPGNIHTTRAVGAGVHYLIDVFAPPRDDFTRRGWVLNESEYEQD